MNMKVGVVMDPIESINYKKDTTLAMLWAAQRHDWQLYYMRQQDIYSREGVSRAQAQPLTVYRDPDAFYSLEPAEDIALADFGVILMRKDPPFDMEFVYTTYLLEQAQRQGTLVVNRCNALRDCNEKVYATQFPQCCPPVLVSRDNAALKAFHAEQGDVIYKPLDGMGGSSIFRARADDPNVNVILETLTDFGQTTIMAQRFLPEISAGDKRILMVDGKPIPHCLARIPAKGETRGNLAAGGTGRPQPLSERDEWIANEVGPDLKARGILFAGLDVIGDYLTEINVTSPTGVRELDTACDLDIAGELMVAIERQLARTSPAG